ncbi:olfactory receptor 6M1-like [Ambystoma mexicanum]|uniref:olfactory receptor 6M1-like n=1 Tax=Ambystoma mexicanum TaxID=8296 RepID=UPI0037E910B7
MEGENQTSVLEFQLLGLSNASGMQVLLFALFVTLYICIVAGNAVIIYLIWTDYHLQKPMYFFLSNLSFLEICFTSVIVPKMLQGFLQKLVIISFSGCMVQLYIFNSLGTTECLLLAVMACDRYFAICDSLHYGSLMNHRACQWLMAGCWTGGVLSSLVPNILISRLPYCGSAEINHFFCDAPQLFTLSCTDTSLVQIIIFAMVSLIAFGSFLLTVVSYVRIISAILKMASAMKRQKVFSTCASHLTVVIIFYGTIGFIHLSPNTNNFQFSKKIAALLYTVITPLLNPLIYSLRNKEVKCALSKALREYMHWLHI